MSKGAQKPLLSSFEVVQFHELTSGLRLAEIRTGASGILIWREQNDSRIKLMITAANTLKKARFENTKACATIPIQYPLYEPETLQIYSLK